MREWGVKGLERNNATRHSASKLAVLSLDSGRLSEVVAADPHYTPAPRIADTHARFPN